MCIVIRLKDQKKYKVRTPFFLGSFAPKGLVYIKNSYVSSIDEVLEYLKQYPINIVDHTGPDSFSLLKAYFKK